MIVNDVCLFYVCYTQQLQLSRLIFVYEKEAVFVLKNRKVVVKFNGVTSSYKTDTPMAKSCCVTERISELEKGIDWIHCVECYRRSKDKVARKVSV